uniref:Origin recognition complex subunit 1 n=1 Tax=Sphenodon punctatus TaxID=8508 RepID=A0A8D0H865_SPHPU
MNTRQQRKCIYSWFGRAIDSDKELGTFNYRGITVKSESRLEIRVLLGEFVLIEAGNVDQFYVARLLKLYEDEKHAVVQWFSRVTEIPLNQRKCLGRDASQEIFLYADPKRDTDVRAETIISNVVPLLPKEMLPVVADKELVFFVRDSWNGKNFKPLSENFLSELNEAKKRKNNGCATFSTECLLSLWETETERVTRSASKPKKSEMEIESKHSVSKSSLSKERHSQRLANGVGTPGARKKLQLNSPTKSTRSKFTDQDVLDLLNDDCNVLWPVKNSTTKQKVTFTGVKDRSPEIPCTNGEPDPPLNIKPLEDHSKMSDAMRLSPYKRGQVSSLKAKYLFYMCITCLIIFPCSVLNASTEEKDDDFLPAMENSDSSSSEEDDDREIPDSPKKKARPSTGLITPKSSGKRSARTPSKTPRKTPEPRTPKTPRNATPRIPCRSQQAQKPSCVLEEARLRLHVSTVPESLPCREEEFQDIYNFVESKLIDGTGGCMYISGVPGTGKTATVHEVIHRLQQAAENNDLPSFEFIEINGMKLTDPHQAYVQILKLLTGQKVTATHAALLLEKLFCTPKPKRKTTVLVVDELDLLWTRKQNVMYNLFDWPTQKDAKLIVLAIANTMDLPERILMNRVASRLGLTRMSFQPYTYKQLQQIISSRLNQRKAFEEDAIQLVSRKVAAVSGDARRCLDICRRSTEICELSSQRSASRLVSMAHIMKAMDEMFSSPYINAIRNASLQEQTFLKATIALFRRIGLEEAAIQQVYHQHVALCRIEGLQVPTVSEIVAVSSRLGTCRLLLVESSSKYLHARVRLNVSQEDVMYALKEE